MVSTEEGPVLATSEPVTIEIVDPCPSTEILTKDVPNLAADIGYFDQRNLRNFEWPWMDSVDLQSGQFGTDKCGLKNYFVTDLFDNPVPFVELRTDGTLIMAPIDGRDVVGGYTCKLNAYMVEFPSITASETFACDIPNCTPVIHSNGARGPTKMTTYWGRNVATFDIAAEMARYTVGPACGL